MDTLKNCLLTRLKAIVNDDSLEFLDDGSIRVTFSLTPKTFLWKDNGDGTYESSNDLVWYFNPAGEVEMTVLNATIDKIITDTNISEGFTNIGNPTTSLTPIYNNGTPSTSYTNYNDPRINIIDGQTIKVTEDLRGSGYKGVTVYPTDTNATKVSVIITKGADNLTFISSNNFPIGSIGTNISVLNLNTYTETVDLGDEDNIGDIDFEQLNSLTLFHILAGVGALSAKGNVNVFNLLPATLAQNDINTNLIAVSLNNNINIAESDGISGDIAVFGRFINLGTLNLSQTLCEGEVLEFVQQLYNRGRYNSPENGIGVGYLPDLVTFNGTPLFANSIEGIGTQYTDSSNSPSPFAFWSGSYYTRKNKYLYWKTVGDTIMVYLAPANELNLGYSYDEVAADSALHYNENGVYTASISTFTNADFTNSTP